MQTPSDGSRADEVPTSVPQMDEHRELFTLGTVAVFASLSGLRPVNAIGAHSAGSSNALLQDGLRGSAV